MPRRFVLSCRSPSICRNCSVALSYALRARSMLELICWIWASTALACSCFDVIDGLAVADVAIATIPITRDAANSSNVGACRFLELIENPLVRWFDRLAPRASPVTKWGAYHTGKDGRNQAVRQKTSKLGLS